MDDLISRQAAIASAISGRIRTLPTTEDGEDWIRVSEVRESLKAVPSAQRTGWWDERETYYRCANCGRGSWWATNYCPSCGSRNYRREDSKL